MSSINNPETTNPYRGVLSDAAYSKIKEKLEGIDKNKLDKNKLIEAMQHVNLVVLADLDIADGADHKIQIETLTKKAETLRKLPNSEFNAFLVPVIAGLSKKYGKGEAIDTPELLAGINKGAARMVEQLFDRGDANHDGILTKGERKKMEEHIEESIKALRGHNVSDARHISPDQMLDMVKNAKVTNIPSKAVRLSH